MFIYIDLRVYLKFVFDLFSLRIIFRLRIVILFY